MPASRLKLSSLGTAKRTRGRVAFAGNGAPCELSELTQRPEIAALLLPLAALLAIANLASSSGAAELFAGNYSISDELGGFSLVSVSGTGTPSDPLVVVEEMPSTGPVVLVIRRHDMNQGGFRAVRGRLTLIKVVANRSGRIWAGYDVELREIVEEPSTRSDGLSFNQGGAQPTDVESDRFRLNERSFEPADRISFKGGSLDPDATLRLRLTITDPTPVDEFYLIQDPSLLSSGLPAAATSFAARAD